MEPLADRLGEVRAPTLVIAGALDDRARPRAESVAAGIPGARLAIVDGSGHTPHDERPAPLPPPRPRLPAGGRRMTARHLDARRRVRGHPLRALRDGHREGDDQPARGAQRVPAADRARADRRVRPHPRRRRRSAACCSPGEGDMAFCSGGDQKYKSHEGGYLDSDGLARLNVLDLQRQIRSLPIPVIALVNGYAIGGGHVLHVVCDLSIASDNAIFGQVGPAGRQLRRRLRGRPPGPAGRRQEGQGDLVPVPPVLGPGGARHGPRQQGRAAGRARGRGRAVGRRDPGR